MCWPFVREGKVVVIGMEIVGGAEVQEKDFWASEVVLGVVRRVTPTGILCALPGLLMSKSICKAKPFRG